jgi:hypothetical protein
MFLIFYFSFEDGNYLRREANGHTWDNLIIIPTKITFLKTFESFVKAEPVKYEWPVFKQRVPELHIRNHKS